MEADKFTGNRTRQDNPSLAESAMGRQIKQFVVGDRRQAVIPGNQALEAFQKDTGSVTGRQAGS